MNLKTEEEAAEVLNVTRSALRRWRLERRGPRYVKMGRLVRYRMDDLQTFVEKNTRKTNEQS